MTIVDNGYSLFRNWLKSNVASGATATVTAPSHMSIGTGSSAITRDQSGLNTVLDTRAFDYASGTALKITYEATCPSTTLSGNTINEYGLFAGSNATMVSRHVSSNESFDGSQELLVNIEVSTP